MKSGIFLLLGSNLGNATENLSRARQSVAGRVGAIENTSSVYRTAAWGNTDQPDFHNQVIEVDTDLEPRALLDEILQIEKKLGRVRDVKWGPRVIDIDILIYGDRVINQPDLIIPHVGIPVRRFTLIPLQEIAADLVHPVLQKKISKLLEECTDVSDVTKV
jgi:2-amino-4-hydroxy-6-hydroxymethyldihydropteridine diphosphokinase